MGRFCYLLSGLDLGAALDAGDALLDSVSGAFGPIWIGLCITVNHPTKQDMEED